MERAGDNCGSIARRRGTTRKTQIDFLKIPLVGMVKVQPGSISVGKKGSPKRRSALLHFRIPTGLGQVRDR